MDRIDLVSTHLHPYRKEGEKFSRPFPDAERLLREGWAVKPENYLPPLNIDISPRKVSLKTKQRVKQTESTKVSVHMATFQGREWCLKESVSSLLNQCDELNIWMNGYEKDSVLPDILSDPKIKLHFGEDVGDIGKFMNWHKWNGYIFTCDDKLIYAPDYVERCIELIEKHGRKAVVSAHGRNLKPNCKSYYNDPQDFFGCLGLVKNEESVHELGTGAMSLHSSVLKGFSLDYFTYTNMTDILFSIYLNEKRIPRIVIPHENGWIKSSKFLKKPSISTSANKNDKLHTDIVNSITWESCQ